MAVLNKLIVKNTEYNKSNSPIALLSILSCLHDLTWVLPHIRTAVALGFIIWLFRAGQGRFRRLCYQTRWGLMDDFRVAKSADFIYEVGNVFLRL